MPFTTLVSTDVLTSHLDGSWAIVDCRYDLRNENWGREEYLAAHIPGAVYASLSHDLAGPVTGRNGRHPLPEPVAIAATFGRFGIRPGVQVVMYDQDSGLFASRMWWMLRYMGHDNAAVLDGGWTTWMREGRPTRAGDEHRPAGSFLGYPQQNLLATVHDVEGTLGDPARLLVDARAPERFEGKTEPLDRVAGHIPGAVNYFYKRNVTADGHMLPPDTLREQFEAISGNQPPENIVMYCGSGVSACQNLLAMEHAGLTGAKLYPGSWSEWSSDPARPIQRGPRVT